MRSKMLPAAVGAILLVAAFTAGLLLGRQTAVPATSPAQEPDDLALKEALINHIRSALSGDAEEFAFKVQRREFFIEGIDRRQGGRSMVQGLMLGWGDGTAPLVRGRFLYEVAPGPQSGTWTFRQVAWRSHMKLGEPVLWP